MSRNYIEQYDRMKRWYENFKDINNGKEHNKNSDYYEDTVYIFFMNCYHLKDWLKKSDDKKFSDVENLFNSRKGEKQGKLCMKICADMCNGVKHMIADRGNRLDKNTKIKSKHISLCLGVGKPIINIGYKIKVNNKTYNAFDIATQCMDEWEKYLKSKNAI